MGFDRFSAFHGIVAAHNIPLGETAAPFTQQRLRCRWVGLLLGSDATGLNGFNIKFFSLQHQMSGINIKKTQDCYQNLLYSMVPILHIHHRFMKPSVWLLIVPSGCQCPICYILL